MSEIGAGKVLLVADRAYHPLLFRYKNENPVQDIKIISKDDLIRKLSFAYEKDPIPFLLKEKFSYSNAKKILSLLQIADYEKNDELNSLHEKLLANGYLAKDPYGEREVRLHSVVLFESEADCELMEFLKRKNIPFSHCHFSDFGAKEIHNEEHPPRILSYPNKIYQCVSILSEIRKRLVEQPDSAKDIVILISDDRDCFYLNFVSSLFKIPLIYLSSTKLITKQVIRDKVRSIHKSKSFLFEEEETNPDLLHLKELVETYGLTDLPFDAGYSNLLEILDDQIDRKLVGDRGVLVSNKIRFDPSKEYFVTNFQYDVFYRVFSDKNVFSDAELQKISANTSYQKTEIDRILKANFIRYGNIAMLSRVRQHLKDKIYDSPLMKDFKWDPKKDVIRVDNDLEGVYTKEAFVFANALNYDRQLVNSPVGDYRSYDPSVVSISQSFLTDKHNWSVTDLESYILCPYAYLMKKVLPLKDDDYHARWFGTFAHCLFERIYEDDYDFENEYQKALVKYENAAKSDGQVFGSTEKAWLTIAKPWLLEIVEAVRDGKPEGFIAEAAEEEVTFTLDSANGAEYLFSGKVDKIIRTDGASGKSYYSIIDYKTGKEQFDARQVFLGRSAQLPLYQYALEGEAGKNVSILDGAKFMGFGIQTVYMSSLHTLFDKISEHETGAFEKQTRANGLWSNSDDYWATMDQSIMTKNGVGKNGGKRFGGGGRFDADHDQVEVVGDANLDHVYNFAALIEDAKRSMVATIEKILGREFPIAPTSSDLKAKDVSRLQCAFCGYGDICYVRKNLQKVSYADAIHDHFHNSDLTINEDTEEEDDDE